MNTNQTVQLTILQTHSLFPIFRFLLKLIPQLKLPLNQFFKIQKLWENAKVLA